MINDARDTYRERAMTSAKTRRQIGAAGGKRADTPPAAAATPFPPLNPNQIGKTCPSRTQKIMANCSTDSGKVFTLKALVTDGARITGRNPFKKSAERTGMDILQPRILNTLVAPALPLPFFLISSPVKTYPAIIAKETDPNKYEAPKIRNITYRNLRLFAASVLVNSYYLYRIYSRDFGHVFYQPPFREGGFH